LIGINGNKGINNMTQIDVIMPTFNQCEFLKRAVDHILAQTFRDFTFIIVNDGSTDNTKNVLEEYKKIKNIVIIDNEKNKGLPSSLNIGHRNGDSPYCTWVSTDNVSYPSQLEELHKKITKGDLDFVQSLWVAKNVETGQIYHQDIRRHTENWGMGNLCASFLYKRKVWETYKYDEEMQTVEDLKFYLQAKLHPFKFGHVDIELVEYYIQGNSLAGRTPLSEKKHKDNWTNLMSKIYKEVIEPKMRKK